MQTALGIRSKLPITCLVTVILLANPAFASLDPQSQKTLSGYEITVFGQDFPKLSEKTRLSKLEQTLYGKTHKGGADDRLRQIRETLDGSQSAKLAPALPPELDRSEDIVRKAPDLAGSNEQTDLKTTNWKAAQADHLLAEAVQYYSQGNTSRAEALFHQVLTLDNRNADAHYNLGAINESRGNLAEALRQYKAAYTANPQDPDIAQALSQVKDKLQRSAQSEKQEKDRKEAQQQEVKQLKDLAQAAANDFHNNNFDQAIAKLNQVLSQAPGDADVHYALAQVLRAKDKANPSSYNYNLLEARNQLGQALSIAPENQDYRKALDDVNNLLAARSSNELASTANANAPPGQIVPMAPTATTPASRQYGFVSSGYSQGMARYLPGLGLGLGAVAMNQSFNPSYRMSRGQTRLSRAIGGTLAGAAIGGMIGGSAFGRAHGGTVKGAIMGGALGLLFDGL